MSATSGHFVKMSSMVDGTLRLTIDVAKEHATEALTTLGFPVGQAVAVTLLHETAGGSRGKPDPAEGASQPPTSNLAERGGKPRTPWHELSRAQQAGIRCGEERFREFLRDRHTAEWSRQALADEAPTEIPGCVVRAICGVTSRAQLDTDSIAAALWGTLDAEYRAWAGLEPEQRG